MVFFRKAVTRAMALINLLLILHLTSTGAIPSHIRLQPPTITPGSQTPSGQYPVVAPRLLASNNTLVPAATTAAAAAAVINPVLAKQWDVLLALRAQNTKCEFSQPKISDWPQVRPTSPTGWPGATVRANRIVGINFAGRDLCRPFLSSMSSLTSLTTLDLSGNPNDFKEFFPPAWSTLTGLMSLKLRSTEPRSMTIPAGWSKMSSLTVLDLSDSGLYDEVPWPAFLSSLQQLRYLDLSSSEYIGPLPGSWSVLKALSHLDASRRDFGSYRTPLPSAWSTLTRLTYLAVNDIGLVGKPPVEWTTLTRLKTFKISMKMNGPDLPAAWGTSLISLTQMDFPDFTWPGNTSKVPTQKLLPTSWAAMKQLRTVSFPCNSLISTPANNGIPIAAQVTSLTVGPCGQSLYQGGGPIVTKLHSLKHFISITSLNIRPWDIDFDLGMPPAGSFSLPPDWGALTKLTSLTLSVFSRIEYGSRGNMMNDVRFQPVLPPAWSRLTNLQRLVIDLHGWAWKYANPPPPSWRNLTSLTHLELLSHRNLDWAWEPTEVDEFPATPGRVLPASWGALTRLQYLDLSDYGLTSMTLPSSWGSMKQLKVLHLHGNCIAGVLPPTWALMANLSDLVLPDQTDLPDVCNDKKLTGGLPNTWHALKKIRDLQLHGHNLTGTLPASWGGMVGLTRLTLNGNQLQGPIPSSWSGLASIAALTLSHNKRLNGPLPVAWTALKHLTSLDVSDNAFSGGVPPGAQWVSSGFWDRLKLVDLSRNKFTGKAPLKPKSAQYFNITGNKFV